MSDLFQRSGLEQDTGLLKDRWGQEGSTLRSAATNFDNTSGVILTVTAGKVFYLSSISFYADTAGGGQIRDGDTTLKIHTAAAATGTLYTVVFDTPIAFTTSVYHKYDVSGIGVGDWDYTIVGWEEEA